MQASSSATTAPNTTFGLINFTKQLECPIMMTTLKDAVMLEKCGHTISEIAAKNLLQRRHPAQFAVKVSPHITQITLCGLL